MTAAMTTTSLRRILLDTGEFEPGGEDEALRYSLPNGGGTVVMRFDPLGGFLSMRVEAEPAQTPSPQAEDLDHLINRADAAADEARAAASAAEHAADEARSAVKAVEKQVNLIRAQAEVRRT